MEFMFKIENKSTVFVTKIRWHALKSLFKHFLVGRFLGGDLAKYSHSQENKPLNESFSTRSREDPSVITFALGVVPAFRGKADVVQCRLRTILRPAI
jgi:hypothetical protein